MEKKSILEIKQPKFHNRHLKMYYDNVVDIIAEELLRKQGFELGLKKPIGTKEAFDSLFSIPDLEERKKDWRHFYDIHPSFWKEQNSWEDYLETHIAHFRYEVDKVIRNREFFGEKIARNLFDYLEKLNSRYIPDLIAKKNEKIYIIEVRNREEASKFLKGKKYRSLLLARKYGFIPLLVSFELNIEANNLKMEEICN